MIRRIVAGLVVLSGAVVLIVGVPWLLLTVAGPPWTWSIPSWDQLYWAVRQGNITASAITTVLAAVAWLAWVDLVWSILWEFIVNVPRIARGQVPRAVPAGVGPIERLARKVVLTTLAISAIVSAASPATASAPSLASLTSLRVDPERAVATVSHDDEPAASNAPSSTTLNASMGQAWVVQRGDSLWDIAEQTLGDGARVDDLIALNPGLEHVSRLIAGQQIVLPPDAHPVERSVVVSAAGEPTDRGPGGLQAEGPDVIVHIVEPGESLWSIADDELGDGLRWHEIYDANSGRQFDDGRQLKDPDLIQPGWDLQIEVPHVVTDLPASTPLAPPVAPVTDPISTASSLPAPDIATRAADEAPAADTAPVLPSSRWITPAEVEPSPVAASSARSLSSVAHMAATARELMLAGGVLALLAVRRRRRLRSTRPRTRLVPPSPHIRDTEQSLRGVEPGGRLARLDVALRAATLPLADQGRRIVAVVYDADGRIRLLPDSSIELGGPWSSEQGWLTLSPAVPLERLASSARQAGIACPTLVQLGVDAAGGAVFVDLEACEAIEIDAADGQGDEIVTALAATLATSALAEVCTIVTVDVDPRATFDHPGAITVADADEALSRARAAIGTTGRADVTTFELRGRGTSGEVWEPAVVLVGSSATPIRLPTDRRGLAIVASTPLMGPSQRFAPDPEHPGMWKLAPLGLVVDPVRVDEQRLQALDELVRSADIQIDDGSTADGDSNTERSDVETTVHLGDDTDHDVPEMAADGGSADPPSLHDMAVPAESAGLPEWVAAARSTQIDDDATLIPPSGSALNPTQTPDAGPDGGQGDGAGHVSGPITDVESAPPAEHADETDNPDVDANDEGETASEQPRDIEPGSAAPGDLEIVTVKPIGEIEWVEPAEVRATIGRPDDAAAAFESADAATDHAPYTFLVRLFGGVEVVGPEGATVDFQRSKSLELVAWLALHRGRRSTRVAARTALWSEDVRDATFANVVSDARRSLARVAEPPPDAEWVGRTLSEALPLHDDVSTDADLIGEALDRARRQSPPAAIATLQPAAELVGGFPFASSNYLWPDAEGITSNLVVLATTITCELAAHHLSMGNAAGVFDATARGLAVIPAHEELIGLRMQAHAMVGDRAGVRAEWESYERAINADLWSDGEPSPKLVTLFHELISGSAA